MCDWQKIIAFLWGLNLGLAILLAVLFLIARHNNWLT